MVEAFLKSVLAGVESLGWSSAKKIAEKTEWATEEVTEALQKLASENRILMRKKGRGHQYGPLNVKEKVEKKVKKEEKPLPAVPPPPSDTIFPSLDNFLLEGINALPKDQAFDAEDFAKALLDAFPNAKWSHKEVMGGIGMLCRLQRLKLNPFTEGASLKYQYIVR